MPHTYTPKSGIKVRDVMDRWLVHIALGSDHHGTKVRDMVEQWLEGHQDSPVLKISWTGGEEVDYPDIAHEACHRINKGQADRAVLICETGIGMSIVANRYPFVRAALCSNSLHATMARRHNDANVLCLRAGLSKKEVGQILTAFFFTYFDADEQQSRRVAKIDKGMI